MTASGGGQRRSGKEWYLKQALEQLDMHRVAATLLFNGCSIGHIKELLGHERLDTTCRYYLALDLRAAKEAHQKFLRYD